jgi:YHS domain-containing protein/ketosteroid isomerase-like protein
MTDARDIVEQYLAAYYRGDARAARRFLADDLSFEGPGAAISTADAYLAASEHAIRLTRGMVTHKVFVDGPDVGVFYDLRLAHPVGSIAVAAWHHLEGDKIATIRTIFDAAPFGAGAGEPSAETAVDPVCRMTVPRDAAAATRHYGGTTYYFCSPGCAVAFEQEPERYLVASR